VAATLAPAGHWARSAWQTSANWISAWQAKSELIAQRDVLQARLDELEAQHAELATSLELARSASTSDGEPGAQPSPPAPLVDAQLIEARLLGWQARAALVRAGLIDAGTAAGVRSDDLVLAAADPLLDQGAESGVAPGQVVLAGRSVWGKVCDVGTHTSTVRGVTDPAYRDLVQILHVEQGRLIPSHAQGVLEGTGDALCRVRHVPQDVAVAPGDFVVAASPRGAADGLWYGTVTRAEPGLAGWELWVQPAAPRGEPARVAVVQMQVNTARR